MFSVYIAGTPDIANSWRDVIATRPDDAVVIGSTALLDQAITDCARDVPGVLLVDDALLQNAPDLLPSLSALVCPVVIVASAGDPEAARRALTIHAKDFLTTGNWRTELFASLERTALPLYPRDRHLGRVISVFSSKGGVGKTTLAVNLSVALAERLHEPIALVDLDLSFGDVAPMLSLQPQQTIHDVLQADSDPAVLKHAMVTARENLYVLAAPELPEQAEDINGPGLAAIIERLREDYAVVVMDMAPGYPDSNVIGLDLSDLILTLCTPDVVTLRTIGQALALFREDFRYPAEKIHLVLNRTGSQTGIERSDIQAILKISRIHELPSAGSLPVRAANQGVPFIVAETAAPLARAIRALAEDLVDLSRAEGNTPTRTRRLGRRLR